MSELKKYFHRKNMPVVREYMPKKYLNIRNVVKKILQDKYAKVYKKKRKLTNQAVNEAITDRVRELLQDGKF